MSNELLTVLIAVASALTSTKAWDFWSKRQALLRKKEIETKEDTHLYRDDLREEVKRLRTELIELYTKREQELTALQEEISELREQLATFKTRVEFLEKENNELRQKLEP
tara:strand:+ start:1398 stop:1727 length:330 start_codon:yes stop_codon:yes gene_type:complete